MHNFFDNYLLEAEELDRLRFSLELMVARFRLLSRKLGFEPRSPEGPLELDRLGSLKL